MPTRSEVILKFPCPTDVYEDLKGAGFDDDSLAQEARESLAARLFSEKRLSIRRAAALAGMTLLRFMDLLRELQIPIVEYDEEQYLQDREAIAALLKRRSVR